MINKDDLALIAVRIVILYLLASVLVSLPMLWSTAFTFPSEPGRGFFDALRSTLTVVGGFGLMAALLWFFEARLVRIIAGKPVDKQRSSTALSAETLFPIVLAVFGLSQFVPAIVSFVQLLSRQLLFASASTVITESDKAALVGMIVRALVGAYFVFGSAGFVGLLRTLRSRSVYGNDS